MLLGAASWRLWAPGRVNIQLAKLVFFRPQRVQSILGIYIFAGYSGLVPLAQYLDEYKDLQRHFSKKWRRNRGRQPKVYFILEIINPSLEQKMSSYLQSIPKRYCNIEKCYHGTQIQCDLSGFLQPCSNTNCGVCGITKNGFDPQRINTRHWQRFGQGFYFAPNSSKSYDYPLVGRGSSTPTNFQYRAILFCDVVAGRKYTLHNNDPELKDPPNGYHSVYGKAKWLGKSSRDFKDDELVVFKAAAIRPRFVLLCENL